jgi:hypothetical protein
MRLAFQQTPSAPDVLMQIAESGAREQSCTRPHQGLLSWRDPVRIGEPHEYDKFAPPNTVAF